MTVLGCSGHQVIPPIALDHVVSSIRAQIALHPPSDLVGVSSLAAGADQLFADAVLAAGARLHVVIPADRYETTFDDAGRRAYEALLASASHIETLPYAEPSEDAFLAAGHRVVDLADVLLAVWDGERAQGTGGTADVVAYAAQRAVRVQVIWPDGISRRH
jgi:hypothetical protein